MIFNLPDKINTNFRRKPDSLKYSLFIYRELAQELLFMLGWIEMKTSLILITNIDQVNIEILYVLNLLYE